MNADMQVLVARFDERAIYLLEWFNEAVARLASAMHSSKALPPTTRTMTRVINVSEPYRRKWGPFNTFNETAYRDVLKTEYYTVSENQPLAAYKDEAKKLLLAELGSNSDP
jgi:hypothetical protein